MHFMSQRQMLPHAAGRVPHLAPWHNVIRSSRRVNRELPPRDHPLARPEPSALVRGPISTLRKSTMQGSAKIIEVLNQLLSEELTAINQYVVHSEMCSNWGYEHLHEVIEKTAIDEMKHAERIISRILFLEGQPRVDKLNAIHIGSDVKAIVTNDLMAEQDAIRAYNEAIQACHEVGDAGTREILEGILKDEEKHLDWREAQRDQIAQMGIENYLAVQAK